MATILDGQKLSKKILKKLGEEVRELKKTKHRLRLGIVLLGKNKASLAYAIKKKEQGEKIGIEVDVIKKFPFEDKLQGLDGVIVQLPLPKEISETKEGINKTQKILNDIPLNKDVDLLTTASHGKLFDDLSPILPPTLSGILKLFENYNITVQGKHVLFVGAGQLVGKPGMIIFKNIGATVSVIDEYTAKKTYQSLLKEAEIIISGVGRPGIITGDMLGADQVIVDAGYGGTQGDIDFKSASKKAKYITPVPGGVGPMTVAMLFWNLIYLAKQNIDKNGSPLR